MEIVAVSMHSAPRTSHLLASSGGSGSQKGTIGRYSSLTVMVGPHERSGRAEPLQSEPALGFAAQAK